MKKTRMQMLLRPLLVCIFLGSGCKAVNPVASGQWLAASSEAVEVSDHGAPTPDPSLATDHRPLATPAKELSLDALIQEVLARNPSLSQMQAAWQAALARYPQVTSLEDPMFGATLGPETFSPDDRGVEFAYRLEISQKYPWPGKRQLRGQNATMMAEAAANDIDSMRLQLMEAARNAFYDYYLAERALEVNQQSLDLLDRIREDAKIRYESSKEKISIQEVYQFNVEISREQQRRLSFEKMREVAKARINMLMHQPPNQPLPPPPKKLVASGEWPVTSEEKPENSSLAPRPSPHATLDELRQQGLARRPDLQAARNRIAADEASLQLAHKESYPDFEPFFMYDRFMGNTSSSRDLASMVGVRVNLPVRRIRRNAAIEEAEATLSQRRAELAKLTDQANFEIEQAIQEVREAAATVTLYETKILKDAEANVEAAQPAYKNGLIPAGSLLEAERALVDLKDRYFQAVADYHRRLAALERATGGAFANEK